jgi:hypothetical protein
MIAGEPVDVHDRDRTGEPPVHPAGDEAMTARACVPSSWHAPQAE